MVSKTIGLILVLSVALAQSAPSGATIQKNQLCIDKLLTECQGQLTEALEAGPPSEEDDSSDESPYMPLRACYSNSTTGYTPCSGMFFPNGTVTPEFRETAKGCVKAVSYTHLRAHETVLDLVCRLLLEKKKKNETS
eukprot:TRINITY_DN29058_c0_g1_i1.p1 TRINITY_DN29058_c0_g1~~TRINITY_DN29058_c0_g1_i1.p1  ORF type:complete len:137 (-),score=35.28 TRINITY_DN29058_c0_g1_i1:3-413(-)